MSFYATPSGMSRRHFMRHLAGSAALVGPAMALTNSFAQSANDLKRRGKSAILLWMGGGPSTIDIWDLKPGAVTGGEFKPISTDVSGIQISEHMPETAKIMKHLSIVRSMSTREADHNRGRYYMHTGYVPNPNIEHPSYGSVLAHELIASRQNTLEFRRSSPSAAAALVPVSSAWPGRRSSLAATAKSATCKWGSTKSGSTSGWPRSS